MSTTNEKLVSRLVMICVSIIMITICGLYNHMNESGTNYYRFGPHDNFIIIGIKINTPVKYFICVLICFINSLIRNTVHNILNPWLINSVQDIKTVKSNQIRCFAYEVTNVITIYNWIDFYIYMNLLLVQVDLFLTEMTADVFMSVITTYYYLSHTVNNDEIQQNDVINPMILYEELN